MDRNQQSRNGQNIKRRSLSARRAWIEILALPERYRSAQSLSARRAWIEMLAPRLADMSAASLSARRAWIEIPDGSSGRQEEKRRSPQGERG